MSAVYNLEPQPTGKVLLETSGGDILLELFAKQTPLASRNFIQLCLEGYYDGTVFHRLVPGFIIQGGDPTGTGEGGEAIYDGGVFDDEFHSRLKFNRRGLLGMANSGTKNDNGSQFFLTLAKTEELSNKNTMFGRIVGDTIYNLMKMGEAELAEGENSELPLYPTKITKTEVLLNPFDDIVPREARQVQYSKSGEHTRPKKAKKKGGKALLSFGVDETETDAILPATKRAKFNPKLVTAGDAAAEQVIPARQLPSLRKESSKGQPAASHLAQPSYQPPERQLPIRNEESLSRESSQSPEPEQISKISSLLDRTNAEIAQLKQSMKRDLPTVTSSSPKSTSALEQMIPQNATRGRKRRHGNGMGGGNDARCLEMLNEFRARLDHASATKINDSKPSKNGSKPGLREYGQIEGDDEAQLCDLHFISNCQSCASWVDDRNEAQDDSEDGEDWMSHSLVFDKDHLGKDLSWKKKHEDDLVVIDPREKSKDIMAEQRAKKAARASTNQIQNVSGGLKGGKTDLKGKVSSKR